MRLFNRSTRTRSTPVERPHQCITTEEQGLTETTPFQLPDLIQQILLFIPPYERFPLKLINHAFDTTFHHAVLCVHIDKIEGRVQLYPDFLKPLEQRRNHFIITPQCHLRLDELYERIHRFDSKARDAFIHAITDYHHYYACSILEAEERYPLFATRYPRLMSVFLHCSLMMVMYGLIATLFDKKPPSFFMHTVIGLCLLRGIIALHDTRCYQQRFHSLQAALRQPHMPGDMSRRLLRFYTAYARTRHENEQLAGTPNAFDPPKPRWA